MSLGFKFTVAVTAIFLFLLLADTYLFFTAASSTIKFSVDFLNLVILFTLSIVLLTFISLVILLLADGNVYNIPKRLYEQGSLCRE